MEVLSNCELDLVNGGGEEACQALADAVVNGFTVGGAVLGTAVTRSPMGSIIGGAVGNWIGGRAGSIVYNDCMMNSV